jgi:WD40 repeat protein
LRFDKPKPGLWAQAGPGTSLISLHEKDKIHIWDASSGAQILTLAVKEDLINSFAVSPDGRHIVSGSYDKSVRLWATNSGEEVLPRMLGHTDVVLSVTYSPSGTQIASGSRDNTVRV